MTPKILFFLLPAIAYARVNVRIKAGNDEQKTNVEFLGSNVEIISDKERLTWKISDEQLKDAAKAYSGGRPSDVFVKSPTPWNDLYKKYGWQQVQRTLYPRSGRILGIRTEPVIITTQEFINNSSVKATYNAGITQSVQETVTTAWTKGGELTIGQEITYSVDIEVAEIGGTTSMSYTASWGEENTKSKAVTVGSSSGVQLELEPGQSAIASLTANRGTMDVEVNYIASLDGVVACNYPNRYKGHYFWAYDINEVLNAAGLPREIESTETITIGFYSDAKTVVNDKESSYVLVEVSAPVSR